MELQKLPIGEQDFETLRRENRLYIDKTELICQMIQDGTYYFLSRPRRFGKSLLLSTIEAYFLGKQELFNGLYIANQEHDWATHPVLHIDFSKQSYQSEQDLKDILNLYLGSQEDIYGANARETSLALRFSGLIQRAYEKTGSGDSIIPLLYQTGYLSILRTDEESQQTWLTFPNKEVNEGFFRFLLPYYSSVQKNRTKAAINSFVDDLRSGNTEQFIQRLQSFFADFQYDAQTTPESHFRNVLYILCKLMGLQVDAEYRTSDGRIDLLLRTDKFVYIIECKIDSTAQVALNQIKEKDYALPWALDGREIVLIGLNFSTNTRRPDDWIVERGSTQVGTQVGTQVSTQVGYSARQGYL